MQTRIFRRCPSGADRNSSRYLCAPTARTTQSQTAASGQAAGAVIGFITCLLASLMAAWQGSTFDDGRGGGGRATAQISPSGPWEAHGAGGGFPDPSLAPLAGSSKREIRAPGRSGRHANEPCREAESMYWVHAAFPGLCNLPTLTSMARRLKRGRMRTRCEREPSGQRFSRYMKSRRERTGGKQ